MRKLVFVVFASLIAFAFSPKSNFNKKAPPGPQEIEVTLNGFSKSQANAHVTLFKGTVDKVPENTQVWFKKEVIQGWYDLLNSNVEKDKSDGIRIYFSRCLPSPGTPIHNNNEIMVVSTFAKDTTIDGKDSIIHVDYFNHLDSDPLFKLASIHGEITHYSDALKGTVLYETCTNCASLPTCNISFPSQIQRSDGERMVQNFHRKLFHKGEINSQSEWFYKDVIEYWLNEMNGEQDGIRVYFSRGDNDGIKNAAKFVFVPTKPSGSDHIDDIDCDPKRISFLQFIKNKKRNRFLDAGVTDNGQLCPNHCSGTTLPQP
ncbi:hypothetical protein [Mucilaginibacter sp.]|uniref:hypothetical protein n=1 Tax=Mucilaginibacter sp. TaxID=1882438 RepID=UPI0025DB60C5|nr:hypothetical protein [Mucilaginibacter sp.]